jgi:hypothetical protein
MLDGQEVTFIALPLIFQQFAENQKTPSAQVLDELMNTVKLYNSLFPELEKSARAEIANAYQIYWNAERCQNG